MPLARSTRQQNKHRPAILAKASRSGTLPAILAKALPTGTQIFIIVFIVPQPLTLIPVSRLNTGRRASYSIPNEEVEGHLVSTLSVRTRGNNEDEDLFGESVNFSTIKPGGRLLVVIPYKQEPFKLQHLAAQVSSYLTNKENQENAVSSSQSLEGKPLYVTPLSLMPGDTVEILSALPRTLPAEISRLAIYGRCTTATPPQEGWFPAGIVLGIRDLLGYYQLPRDFNVYNGYLNEEEEEEKDNNILENVIDSGGSTELASVNSFIGSEEDNNNSTPIPRITYYSLLSPHHHHQHGGESSSSSCDAIYDWLFALKQIGRELDQVLVSELLHGISLVTGNESYVSKIKDSALKILASAAHLETLVELKDDDNDGSRSSCCGGKPQLTTEEKRRISNASTAAQDSPPSSLQQEAVLRMHFRVYLLHEKGIFRFDLLTFGPFRGLRVESAVHLIRFSASWTWGAQRVGPGPVAVGKKMRPLQLQGHSRPITQILFSYTGELLFTCARDGVLCVWDVVEGCLLGHYSLRIDDQEVVGKVIFSVDVTYDGQRLAAACAEGAFVFDVETRKQLAHIPLDSVCRVVAWNKKPDEQNRIVLARDQFMKIITQEVQVYAPEGDGFVKTHGFSDYTGRCIGAAWGPFDTTIVSSHETGNIIVWDLDSGDKISDIQAHDATISCMDFTLDRALCLTVWEWDSRKMGQKKYGTASLDGSAKLWALPSWNLIRTYTTDRPLNSCSISPLFDAADLPRMHILLAGGQKAADVTTTKTSKGKQEAILMNMVNGEILGLIGGHFSPINSISFSPDGKAFATGAEEGVVKIYRFDPSYFDPRKFV